jgi:hypothetical protein
MNGHLRAANSTIDVKGRLYLIRPVMSNKKGTIVTLGLRSKPQHNRLKPTRSKQVYDTCNVYIQPENGANKQENTQRKPMKHPLAIPILAFALHHIWAGPTIDMPQSIISDFLAIGKVKSQWNIHAYVCARARIFQMPAPYRHGSAPQASSARPRARWCSLGYRLWYASLLLSIIRLGIPPIDEDL